MAGLSTLQHDHRTIERFLIVLRSVLADAGIVGPWRPDLELAAEFIDVFVVGFHHHHEEDSLFAFLVERGIDSDTRGNPLAHDHRELNARRVALRDALNRPEQRALEDAVTHLTTMACLLEEHLTEERRLYAEIHRRLTAADERELDRRLERSVAQGEDSQGKTTTLLRRLGLSPEEPPARCA